MSSEHLIAAAAAGRRIVEEAVWHDGRCNWLGATSGAVGRYQALGPTLYKGTAGVGLFLAHLGRATGDADARRTALGALRHAVGSSSERPDLAGFHVGATGIAWAAVTASALLDAPELRERAGDVLNPAIGTSPDIMTGIAGTIVGLLALAGPLEEPRLIDRAADAGEELLRAATSSHRGLSWPTPDRGGRRHLYGLGYGANGIAWALLELYAASGDDRFRTAAERGFEYERSWLRADTLCWAFERKHGSPLPSSGSWCHGEAGIGLTRTRASELLRSDQHRRDAELARAATRRHLEEELRLGIQDLSLCHGVAGAAEALPGDAAIIERLSDFALSRDPAGWPGGVGHGTTPALFRGTSGIAWWLLRIADPATPSPLALPTG